MKLFRWGGDCYAYGLLASGHVDLVVENALKLYDFAALVPVIKGAGGLITDWQGKELDIHSDGSVLAAGDRRRPIAPPWTILGGGRFGVRPERPPRQGSGSSAGSVPRLAIHVEPDDVLEPLVFDPAR